MNLMEMLPALKELPHADKLRAVQFLVAELAKEENVTPLPTETYPVWTPFNAFEAAHTLMELAKARQES